MASVKKIETKKGISYKITVSNGDDLQGRKITVPAKGVYIQNGRKFVVK